MQDLFAKGGVLVVPILFCSVLALAIFVERFIRFAILHKRGLTVDEQVTRHLSKNDPKTAAQAATDSRSPMGRILVQALDVMGQDRETLETVLVNAIDAEVRELSRYLQTLATIANVVPLLGLLGTVVGMIKAFMVIQQMGGKVNAAVLAGGIWEAMLTTALGLAVALPTMVAHSYLVGRVDGYEARLQTGCVRFVKTLGGLQRN